MRKKLFLFISVGIMVVMLVACGSTDNPTSSSNVPNGKEETSITGQIENEKIENSNGDESSIDSSVDSTSTVETTTEAPTTTVEPETTTEAPTTTVEPETTTEAPTTTVEPETTTEAPKEELKNVIEYTINTYGECVINKINKLEGTEFVFPKEIDGYPVGVISYDVFSFDIREHVTSVILPEGLRQISGLAFSGCVSLTSIEIPDSVTTMGGSAFAGCTSITSIKLPNGLSFIEGYTFEFCTSLTSIEIPDGVTKIGPGAFAGCTNLKSVKIPDSVTWMGNGVFDGCDNLINIEVTPGSYAESYLKTNKIGQFANTPTVPEVDDGVSTWTGDYDNLPSDGFDHIKVPTIDDFYDEGLSNDDGAFDFGNRPEWEKAWYDAYDEFLVALGSPVDDEGNVYPAFMSINPGYTQGYQYLYYGVNWSDDSNGWGDIVLLPVGLNSSMANNPNYDGAYVLETTNFFYGEIDKELEDEYRAATTMMLSWIVPNPQEVEKAIYEFHTDQVGNTILVKNVLENGFGSWVQVGDVDIAVALSDIEGETLVFAIRNHK